MTTRSFDRIEIGESRETPGVTVTDWRVMTFAAVSTDYFELHANDEYAKRTQFGRRAAHGRKRRSAFQVDAGASLHWSWGFIDPIYIGDTIRAKLMVTGKKASRSKPDRDVVTVAYEARNQNNEAAQRGTDKTMVRRCSNEETSSKSLSA